MAALKALVIFLGILLVGGFIVVAVTIYNRATAPKEDKTVSIPVPANGTVMDTVAAGDRVVMRYRMADGSERLVIVNARTGKPAGTINLVPTP